MADMIHALATRTGINPETVRCGLGAVLTFLKAHFDPEVFGRVQSSVPDSQGMQSAFESASESSSPGLLGSVANLAGKLLGGHGGGGGFDLLGMLSRAGLSVEQVQAFLPKATEFLRAHLPADLLARIEALVLQAGKASGGTS
jgi:hypothetical protein